MRNDCVEVDELILELADYKNNYADVAEEKLLRQCTSSWDAYQYLLDRVHDAWLPTDARRRMQDVIMKIQIRLHAFHEYGWKYEDDAGAK